MQPFRNLRVWQTAHAWTKRIYLATSEFPASEKYGLTAQLRSAAVSVGANIAEGCARRFDIEFARFLNVAQASATEAEYLLLIAREVGMPDSQLLASLEREASELSRSLNALRKKVDFEARTEDRRRRTTNGQWPVASGTTLSGKP